MIDDIAATTNERTSRPDTAPPRGSFASVSPSANGIVSRRFIIVTPPGRRHHCANSRHHGPAARGTDGSDDAPERSREGRGGPSFATAKGGAAMIDDIAGTANERTSRPDTAPPRGPFASVSPSANGIVSRRFIIVTPPIPAYRDGWATRPYRSATAQDRSPAGASPAPSGYRV